MGTGEESKEEDVDAIINCGRWKKENDITPPPLIHHLHSACWQYGSGRFHVFSSVMRDFQDWLIWMMNGDHHWLARPWQKMAPLPLVSPRLVFMGTWASWKFFGFLPVILKKCAVLRALQVIACQETLASSSFCSLSSKSNLEMIDSLVISQISSTWCSYKGLDWSSSWLLRFSGWLPVTSGHAPPLGISRA